jgi:hypothetical protein
LNLRPSEIIGTRDLPLWSVIRDGADRLSFSAYLEWMDVLSADEGAFRKAFAAHVVRNSLPFPDIISYRSLKLATDAFLLSRCPVLAAGRRDQQVDRRWRHFLESVPTRYGGRIEALPFLALMQKHEPGTPIALTPEAEQQVELCNELIAARFRAPCLLELIWSYWHEEGTLVSTTEAISMRFQNRARRNDSLAHLPVDPLRPLSDRLSSYAQAKRHRLAPARRAMEYDHQYGLKLTGRRSQRTRKEDPDTAFLDAFHVLLHAAYIFDKQKDGQTRTQVFDALRNLERLLTKKPSNQFGDLSWTARNEMLIQQWLLARPEVHEFLGARRRNANREPWMESVDAVNKLQGRTDTPVRLFHDLAACAEQLLLSIRLAAQSDIRHEQAANWARYWRPEIQSYIRAYQAATRITLSPTN